MNRNISNATLSSKIWNKMTFTERNKWITMSNQYGHCLIVYERIKKYDISIKIILIVYEKNI